MNNYKTVILSAISTFKTGDLKISKLIFEKLAKEYPYEIEPYYYLGIIEAKNSNLENAILFLQKSLKVRPSFHGYKALSEIYTLLNDKINTIKNIKMALIYDSFNENLKNSLLELTPNTNFINKANIYIDGYYEKSKDCPYLKYIKSYDAQIINRTSPEYKKTQLSETQTELIQKTIAQYTTNNTSEGFVLEIPNGLVFVKQSEQTIFTTSNNKILGDTIDPNGPQPNFNYSLPEALTPCENLLVLSSCWGGNFYHWLTWTIPRLKMIIEAGYNLQDFDKILINYNGYKFQKEIVELIGIPCDKIIGTLEKGAIFNAKKIVTASLPEFLSTPKIVTQSLRNTFLSPSLDNANKPKRIYLSRNKSKSRHIKNEDELLNFLKNYNFTTIYAEDLTFTEQVEYFSNADIILSQHGAGLTNIAFSKENTQIIEIYNEKLKNNLDTSFWRISSDVNLKHYLMFGEPIGDGPTADMYVNLHKLKEIFQLAKITNSTN